MTFEEIFKQAKASSANYDVSKIDGHLAVQVNIIGEGSGIFYIELKDHKVYTEPYEYYDRDCILIASADDFLKMADGKMDPVAAYTKGVLKVEGSIDKALEFSKILKTAKTASKSAEKPAKEKAEKAAGKSADKPAEKAETKPAEKAETKPADKPAEKTEAKKKKK